MGQTEISGESFTERYDWAGVGETILPVKVVRVKDNEEIPVAIPDAWRSPAPRPLAGVVRSAGADVDRAVNRRLGQNESTRERGVHGTSGGQLIEAAARWHLRL